MLDDLNEYISGFVVEDIHQLIAGHEIYDFEQFKNFIMDVVNHNDIYKMISCMCYKGEEIDVRVYIFV